MNEEEVEYNTKNFVIDEQLNIIREKEIIDIDEFELTILESEEVENFDEFLEFDLTHFSDEDLDEYAEDLYLELKEEGLNVKKEGIYQALFKQRDGIDKEDLKEEWLKLALRGRKSLSKKESIERLFLVFRKPIRHFQNAKRFITEETDPIKAGGKILKEKLKYKAKVKAAKATKSVAKLGIKAVGKVGKKIGAKILAMSSPLIIPIIFMLLLLVVIITILGVGSSSANGLSGKALLIYNYLHEKDVEDLQIASIMGNMAWECGSKDFKTDSVEHGDNIETTTGGIGLCQWTAGRKDQYLNYVRSTNQMGTLEGWSDLNKQLDFFWFEFCPNSEKTFADLQWSRGYTFHGFYEKKDLKGTVEYFCYGFERPDFGKEHIEERLNYAEEFLNKINAGVYDSSSFLAWLSAFAEDDIHGYTYGASHGQVLEIDVDCSSFVYWGLVNTGNLENVGCFTTLTIDKILKENGFSAFRYEKESDLIPGDILVNKEHTEVYYDDGKLIGAHTDSLPQSAQVSITNFYEGKLGWEWVYRIGEKNE